MQVLDSPLNPEALAVASAAVLFALLDALSDKVDVASVVRTAKMGLGNNATESSLGAEAARLIANLERRYPLGKV